MNRKILVFEGVERAWDIEGFPDYFFGKDKKLYRYDSQGRIRRNKQTVIGYTTGYVLKSKFFSIARLRPMLRRHKVIDPPYRF